MPDGLSNAILFILCFFLILTGFIGILFPIVPSIPFIWFGIVLFAIATNFQHFDSAFILLVSVFGLVVVLIDFMARLWGGKEFRANAWSVIGAVIGGLVGSFFGYLYAFVIGPLVGAIVSELLRGRDRVFSLETRRYIIIGYIGGTIVKFAVGITMVGLFIWQLVD